ncbi:MAG: hypothetical protein HZA20_05855 [Nitrospirae bacterium]|nr:hypothetical protein [Nitrospirota bacterium]
MRIDEHNSFESLSSRYSHCLSALTLKGIGIAGASRLRTYAQRLEQAMLDPRTAVEPELIATATFDLREIDEIIEIVNHLPNQPDQATLDLLRKLSGGTDHPDDEIGAVSREAQYELYIGTVLRQAGLQVKHGEPDLVAEWRGRNFFIEAKRPSSPNRVDDRLRSAIHQIRRLPTPTTGIIALSLDQVLRPLGGLLTVKSLDDISATVVRLIQGFVTNNSRVWRNRLQGQPVSALIMTARIPGYVTQSGHSALGSNLHVELLSSADENGATHDFIEYAFAAYGRAQGETVFKIKGLE